MKKLIAILALSTSLCQAGCDDEVEVTEGKITKVEFDGHTYVHYRSYWGARDTAFFHDPNCECGVLTQKRIKEVRELIRNLDELQGDD